MPLITMWFECCFETVVNKLGIEAVIFVAVSLNIGYGGVIGHPTYVVVAGGRVELPCDLNATSDEDQLSLIMWHRDGSGSPVYSVDAREASLSTARHFPGLSMKSRAFFDVLATPSMLRIDGVRKEEEGNYRCRVEYKRSRTETTDLQLIVIVPPKEAIIMDEYGQHLHGVIGPYNEGFPLALACEGEGGDPSPAVKWWRGNELLDDSFFVTPQGFARNELLLHSLGRRDLMTRLTCMVANSNLTAPVTSTVILDMNLRPTEVRITSLFRPFSATRPTEVVCVGRGARPPAQLSWWADGEKLTTGITESAAREENLTVSSLVLTPTRLDHQRNLSCRGDNPQIPDSVIEDSWLLDVHYLPKLSVKLDRQPPITEGDSVTLSCDVDSNPPIGELEWLQDGRSLGPPARRRDARNRTFTVPSVEPRHRGRYQCVGVNSEGKAASEAVLLAVHYAPRCQSVRSSVYGVGRTESVSVACEVDAAPVAVVFSWSLDGGKELPVGQYWSNGTRSVATVSPRSPTDYGVLTCWASNAVGKQKEPCTFRIVPAGPPEEPRNCVVTNTTSSCLALECERGQDGGLQQQFRVEVFGTGSDRFLANVTSRVSPVFAVCSLPPRTSLILVVYAVNSKGKSKQVAVHASTLPPGGDDDEEEESGTASVILGIVIGALSVLLLLGSVVLVAIKLQARRTDKDRHYRPNTEKSDAHLMKECKEPCVASSQGPDIIPEKSFYQERSSSVPKVIEVEQGVNPASSQSDPSSRKYREFHSATYPDDPNAMMTTPRKLRILHDAGLEVEAEDCGVTVETPLISSIPPILQQWTDHRKEGVRLSTPV